MPARQTDGPSVRGRRRPWPLAAILAGLVGVLAVGALGGIAVYRAMQPAPTSRAPSDAPGAAITPALQMPDPFVLTSPTRDYLYTGGYDYQPPNVPVRSFTRFGHWGRLVDAMPSLPPWSSGWIWAPDVRKIKDHYVMWFATPDVQTHLPTGATAKCIGVATASSPLGPFTPSPQPSICQAWGSIDPRTIDLGGQLYLYWKADTNADTHATIPTTIWAARLAPNGEQLTSAPVAILTASQAWQEELIEAPQMVVSGHRYYLFYSGSKSFTPASGIGIAKCKGPLGPCKDIGMGPLLGSNPQGAGPGEESLFAQNGSNWLLYAPAAPYGAYTYRSLAIARVAFDSKGPYLAQLGTLPHADGSA